MKIEAIGKLFIYRWPGGEVRLEPGKPIDLPPDRAAKLLARASGRVRQVEPEEAVIIEPDVRWDGATLSPVYFERNDGCIYGPAKILDFMQASAGGPKRDWLVVEHQGLWEWVLSDRLRTRAQFEQQLPMREVERIEEPR